MGLDPLWSSVAAYLPLEGRAGSSRIAEWRNNRTVSRYGTPLPVAVETPKVFGRGSIYFPGNGSTYCEVTEVSYNSLLALNSTDYAIECWAYLMNAASSRCMVSSFNAQGYGRWALYVSSTRTLIFNEQGANGSADVTISSAANAVPLNEWIHVAACKQGTTVRLFLNGFLLATGTSAVRTDQVGQVRMGRFADDASFQFPWFGCLQDVRVTRAARYTAPFTVPTNPFTEDMAQEDYDAIYVSGARTFSEAYVLEGYRHISKGGLVSPPMSGRQPENGLGGLRNNPGIVFP